MFAIFPATTMQARVPSARIQFKQSRGQGRGVHKEIPQTSA